MGELSSDSCLELAGEPIVFAAVQDALLQVTKAGASAVSASGELLPRGRFAQFDAWANTLLGHERSGPARVVVIEDVHWADESTLDFLTYLVRSLRRYPLMLVMTRRDDQVSLAPGATTALGKILRLPHVISLPLRRLNATEANELVMALTGRSDDDGRPQQLFRLCDGNPYLLSELADAGGEVPDHIRDVPAA